LRVLVTGAAGFLGSHLVDRLVLDGAEVIGVDNLKRGRFEHIQGHLDSGKLTFHEADIRHASELEGLMAGVDTVYHLAAQSNVMGAFDDPDYSFETNVLGTYNVLKAAQRAGVGSLVFSSSREVYGEPKVLPASEDQPVEPKNPYGASKLAGEAYCRVWRETMGLNCTILRFGNLFGSRDSNRVIPIWLERALAGQELLLYGGSQVLDFVWVDMAVEALIRATKCGRLGPINVANGKGTSLQDLAKRIRDVTGTSVEVRVEPARQAEVTKFIADVKLMRDVLGLEPEADPLVHLGDLRDMRQASG
jgi:UDP-glucose 4-epimerase